MWKIGSKSSSLTDGQTVMERQTEVQTIGLTKRQTDMQKYGQIDRQLD